MKKNHFIFGYAGNKRTETPQILEKININNFNTIIEPFCGSCAFSYIVSTKMPKKFKYVLNDIDKNLIRLLEIMKDKEETEIFNTTVNYLMSTITSKDKYVNIISRGDLYGWFIAHKVYNIRSGLYKTDYKYNEKKPFKLEDYPIYNFMNNEDVTITCKSGLDIIEKYKNDDKSLFFIDPPYLIACNDFYDKNYSVNIYEWMAINDIRNLKSFFVIVLEKNWIISLLFKDYYTIEYNKLYQPSKKKTTHLMILNNTQNNII
jgi:site-specific DNA-adenine methylase